MQLHRKINWRWPIPIKTPIHINTRYQHTVRVRFAPSPTGYLHLGGLRTALYNFLYARNQGGQFLLRIEDTDQSRLVPDATKRLIDDLLWAGIEIDEGPGFGGDRGPYVQSERRTTYQDALKILLDNKTAYRCFCSERRLDLLRKDAMRTRQIPRYDNKCRHLTPDEIADKLGKGTPHCIRFHLTAHNEPLNDLIYGPVHHNVSDNEGDPVIMKMDNFPTYHFANVVDDHLMGITHVFRGVEWQISTPKHLLLYKAFGWQPPQYGHLPLLVNPDGTKLSKRQGDIGIQHFRDNGYFPIALLNYVISTGGGFPHEVEIKPQIHNIRALTERFDIKRVNSHPSRLNPNLLDDLNRLQITKLLNDETKIVELVRHVQDLIAGTYKNNHNLDLDPKHIESVLRWCAQRLTFIKDLTSADFSFLWIKPSNFTTKNISKDQIHSLLSILENATFSKDELHGILKAFAQQHKLKFADLMKDLRSALSGLKEGPGVAEMMEILGKRVVLERIRNALHVSSPELFEKRAT